MKYGIRASLVSATAIAAAVCGLTLASPSTSWAQARTYPFDIPPEDGAKALNDFSRQSGVQLLFPFDLAAKANVPGLKGTYTRQEALNTLLAATGLEVASQTDDTISLRVKERPGTTGPAETPTEVIVTGTHIRGGNPTAPVHTVTRADIEASGYTQLGDVIHSLPENFGGGQNPGIIGASRVNINNQNYSNETTVNLRGLGADATLTLLNGHRLSSDGYFQGADISGIPLAAVQRVEIVADGTSALYGSEAVAGVANVILRKTYNGAQVSASYGAATQGGGASRTVNALVGTAGANGYILGNIEYQKSDGIFASQRSATSGVKPQTTVLQPQTRKSAFLAGGRDLTDRLSIAFDALVSDRSNLSVQQYPSYVYTASMDTPAYSGSVSADYRLTDHWRLHATAVASGSHNSQDLAIPAFAYTAHGYFRNAVKYGEVTADGPIAHLPGGDVKAAIGGGYRREDFRSASPGESSYFLGGRHVAYLYGELSIPVVAPSADRTGFHAMDVSLSARAEDYSDLGKSTNPRIGIRYVPLNDLALRATWGKSFKAPSFFQLHSMSLLYAYAATTSGYTGPVSGATVLIAQGGNVDLKPERSTSWTLGADYTPAANPFLKLSATYFDIDYRDRVVQPINQTTQGLSNPIYAPFAIFNPTQAQIDAAFADADLFTNYSGAAYDPAKVVGILLDRYTNATAQTVRGMDLSYRQSFASSFGTFDVFGNATWIRLKQQTIISLPFQQLSGTIGNVPKFKARGGVTWRRGGLSATLVGNYVAAETDAGVSPAVPIGSWTTADLNLSYAFGGLKAAPSGLRLGLAISNLFDKKPPYAVSPALSYAGVHYDSTNTSVIGRFVTLSVTKDW